MNRLLTILAALILNLFLTLPGLGQSSKMLSGLVLNDAKQPVSQVTINIPGSEPVYTGEDGVFKIARVDEKEWLFVTPLEGYSPKKILLTNQENITIYLTSDDIMSPYAEVLTPLDNKSSRDIISSFKALETSEFEKQPYTSAEQYLQGNVSGTYVTQSSGTPGSGASVYIRGYSSLLSNNQPLYIVDGVPFENSNIYDGLLEGDNYSPISTIDPLDITEITVLKDAAGTALYGAKGANGVVIIKTLEPKETKTTINFLYRFGVTLAPEQLPQLGAKAYKTLANEVLFSSGMAEEDYKQSYPGLFLTPEDDGYIRYNHNSNWQDEVFKNALTNNFRFSIKGGDAIAKYGLSVGYLRNNGIVKNTYYDRLNIRLVGAFDIFSWLKMDVATNLTRGNSYLEESGLSSVTSPLLSSLWKSPMLNPYEYDDDGNLLKTIDEVDELGTSNPTAIVGLSDAESKNYRFMTSVNLTGDITENLKFTSLLGLNSSNTKEFLFIPNRGFDLLYDDEVFNESTGQNNSLFTFFNDNRIFYNKVFNQVHDLYGAVGFRWQKNEYDQDYGVARNTASDYFTNLNRGENLYNLIGGSNSAWNWGALYSNVSYSYADKYLLSATLSSDVSSRVGDNAVNTIKVGDMPVGIFYSLAGAWRISNEKFFSNVKGIEELKLRASYGITGNDDVGEVNSFSHFLVSQYRDASTLIPGGLANDELTFQTKKQFNVGLDFSALANRFSFSINYFDNQSENVVILELQNSYLGYDTYPNNSASFSTKGFEAEVFGRVVSRTDFSLDLGFNISKYSTILDQITSGQQILDVPGQMQIINRVGEPINSFYGYRFKGVYASSEEANDANMYNFRGMPYRAGDAIYENIADANGNIDNVIDKNDKQLLGSFEPDFYGGFFINTRYKNFSLNMFFQGVYGNEVYNYLRQQNESMTGLENQSVKTLQRWQYEGQQTSVPKATWNDPMGNTDFSDRWIEDGSYLRLKSLTLSYDVKKKIIGLSSLKVFATASNLFTLSKYLSYDPEFSYSQDLGNQGVDFANMPVSKQFMFGVNIGL
jgi:TonB-linked SusC/RagA family outer membrane protein